MQQNRLIYVDLQITFRNKVHTRIELLEKKLPVEIHAIIYL
jgi:hypothetical protein